MHRIRQWMSSVALVSTAGLVIVAAWQTRSVQERPAGNQIAPASEPPRLMALPLPESHQLASELVPGEFLADATRVTQHTYPIREPSSKPRQPWRGELPLEDMLPDSPASSPRVTRVREPEYDARPVAPTRKQRRPAPVVEEYVADEAIEEYDAGLDVESAPQRRVQRPLRTPPQPAEESILAPRFAAPQRDFVSPREEAFDADPAPRRATQAERRPEPVVEELPEETYAAAPRVESLPRPTPPGARMARGQIDVNSPSMRAVLEKAREHTRHGFSLGQRGAIYSARAEFVQALRLVAQALDTQTGGDQFGQSLAAGLKALEEADDFAPKGSKLEAHLKLEALVDAHETPVLKELPVTELNSLQALQHYYAFAREQLAYATGHTVAGSEALYALGKLQTQIAQLEPSTERMYQAKGMAFHQAALDADSRNYQAANELAVLLARHGQWETAKTLFVHSVQLQPQPEVWRNLATVHATLGEHELARLAENERRLMQPEGPVHPLAGQVQWVDPTAFAATGPRGAPVPHVASQPRPQPPAQQPASTNGNWITPWTSFLR